MAPWQPVSPVPGGLGTNLRSGAADAFSAKDLDAAIVRLRLQSFLLARFGRAALTRRPTEPVGCAWSAALGTREFARFTWTTFDDDQSPRAIGMRLTRTRNFEEANTS